MLPSAGDARMLARGGVLGAKRIARHLWRMCFGLFIAAGSFFLGPSNRPLRLLSTVGLGQHLSPALFSTSSCPISILVRPMFINVDWAAQTMRRFGNMLRATISQLSRRILILKSAVFSRFSTKTHLDSCEKLYERRGRESPASGVLLGETICSGR
jgi:hypothetical protein